ncbi:YegP family protein [Anaerovorax odorimutans]|uniref:hypothetical protein n=1 Tax=Anaerovorax odorimutans TaxID=109327 RepID=UPI000424A7A6|nr:hypothetical protein [Anaerovorax odorimutans]
MFNKRAVFEIKQNSIGNYYFTFNDSQCKTTVISRSFSNRAELETCLAHIRDAAMVADVCDCGKQRSIPPYFLMQSDEEGITFSLIGFHGEIIFSSVPYLSEMQCKEAISTLKVSSQRAGIVDLTID